MAPLPGIPRGGAPVPGAKRARRLPLPDQGAGRVRFEELILALIDAGTDRSRWPRALEGLARYTGVRSVNLDVYDLRRSRGSVSAQHGIPLEYVDAYNAEAIDANPLVEAAHGQVCSGDIRTSSQLLSAAAYERSELFQMLLRPSGHGYVAGIALEVSESAIAHVSFNKAGDARDFSERDLDRLRSIQPWLTRAYRIHQRLSAAEQHASELSRLWDQVQHAVFVLDRQARIRFANRAAESLLRWRVGVCARAGRLRPLDARAAATLAAALNTPGNLALGAGSLRLPRGPGQAALVGTLFPIDEHCLGLLVSDPERGLDLPLEALQELFLLTQAEARLVLALVEGQTLREHADAEGIRYATARTHLKNAMSKNGWRRQAEMVAAVMRCLLPMGEWPAPP
jgi:DNA-binding CsgD family transcriptional regulator/PAS domain-containing protein